MRFKGQVFLGRRNQTCEMQSCRSMRSKFSTLRGNPTLKVFVELEDGTRAGASVPSGASTGAHEAIELRDGDPDAIEGKGVRRTITNVIQIIRPKLIGYAGRAAA